jgi:hypothetical protein
MASSEAVAKFCLAMDMMYDNSDVGRQEGERKGEEIKSSLLSSRHGRSFKSFFFLILDANTITIVRV